MDFYITGDCHGIFKRFKKLPTEEQLGVVILGDAGLDYLLDVRDDYFKLSLFKKFPNIIFYLVRGNHEENPAKLKNIKKKYDENVKNDILILSEFPNIRYLIDGETYDFNGKTALILGGAYSVDKFYRLESGQQWFPEEQLSAVVQAEILFKNKGKNFDFVFSHTCPYEWQPFDLFLSFINQDTVDNRTEYWLSEMAKNISWGRWYWGHFHGDRTVDLDKRMLFETIEYLA